MLILDCTTRLKMGTRCPLENNAGCRCRTETKLQHQFCRGQLESARHDVWFRFRERREWEGPRVARDPGHRWPGWARIRGGRVVLGGLACANPHVRTFMSHLAARSALCHRPSRSTAGAQRPGLSDARGPPLLAAASVALNCTVLYLTAIQVGERKITRTWTPSANNSRRGQTRQRSAAGRGRVRRRCQVPAERTLSMPMDARRPPTPYCAVMS